MKRAWILIPVLSVLTPAIPNAAYGREAVALAPDNLTTLPAGTRIRVNAPRLDSSQGRNPWVPIVGTFARVRRDTLEMQAGATRQVQASLVAIPITSIDGVERWTGRKGNGRLGMVIGLVLGAGVAALVTPTESPENGYAVAAGGLGGILWGGLIGSIIKTNRWKEVPLTPATPEGTK